MSQYKIIDTIAPKRWEENLPLGNGRLGAGMMCGISEEHLYLNEETIWSSQYDEAPNPYLADKLHAIRQLFLEGKPAEGDKLAKQLFDLQFPRVRSFESAGILKIALHESDYFKNYRHELDLINGIATLEYDKNASHYTRTCFVSYPDDVIVYHVESSQAPLKACVAFDRENTLLAASENNELFAIAKTVFGNHKFCVKAQIVTDGTVCAKGGDLYVSDTYCFTILISIATQFRHGDTFAEVIQFPQITDYPLLKQRHTADFCALMNRADIRIPGCPELENLSLHERFGIRRNNKPMDDGLIALQWQYGRYLLVSSSRPGSLPANLQGVWEKGFCPPWSSDYHTNINLQANYWGAEVANLSECHLPLFDYMNKYLFESGKKTAAIGYGTRGCVVHHLSDIYQFTTVADGLWGIWPHGASWLSHHMWEHYLFTLDQEFLQKDAYSFIREAAIFFLENMVENKDGYLVYGPSTSPENRYWVTDENGEKYSCYLTLSSTMDVGIIKGLFQNFLSASQVLDIEDSDVCAIRKAMSKLPPFRISQSGRLQEWMEDYEETEKGHYHISHSFALFPGNTITRKDPELMEALSKTISSRIHGGLNAMGSGAVNVGWSLGWLISLLSRLRRGDEAREMANNFVSNCVNNNLWDKTAGGKEGWFQIDGNLAFVGGICEMLLQSHEETIALIPAISRLWHYGSFRGLRARGGVEIDLEWKESEVRHICLRPDHDGDFILELPPSQKHLIFRDQYGSVYQAKDLKLSVHCAEELLLTAEIK